MGGRGGASFRAGFFPETEGREAGRKAPEPLTGKGYKFFSKKLKKSVDIAPDMYIIIGVGQGSGRKGVW